MYCLSTCWAVWDWEPWTRKQLCIPVSARWQVWKTNVCGFNGIHTGTYKLWTNSVVPLLHIHNTLWSLMIHELHAKQKIINGSPIAAIDWHCLFMIKSDNMLTFYAFGQTLKISVRLGALQMPASQSSSFKIPSMVMQLNTLIIQIWYCIWSTKANKWVSLLNHRFWRQVNVMMLWCWL